jgi:AcrR family transcriptional regulator
MSGIAERAGISRATLYRYFPDVESVLTAWHERHVLSHLERMTALSAGPGSPGRRLAAVLETYALIAHHRGRHGDDLRSLLHPAGGPTEAEQQVVALVRGLLDEAVESGEVRSDTPPAELTAYCLRALEAAGDLPTETAVRRLVSVTVDGLHG